MTPPHLVPDWPAPPGIRALSTLRSFERPIGPYADFNYGDHVGDHPETVVATRDQLASALGLNQPPAWLNQIHGTLCVEATPGTTLAADASYTHHAGTACVIMTADCLPVLFAAQDGTRVAAAHAGWKGLADGILEATLAALATTDVLVWLGPAIGPESFEVGPEVREAFLVRHPNADEAFTKTCKDRYHADLYRLARIALTRAGVAPESIYGGGRCTFRESNNFFSYRRDRTTGRMATLIWREEHPNP
jgi:YfiH family protein